MDPEFWRERWQQRQLAFHRSAVHPALLRHGEVLQGRRRVLVPLCGKSLDLWWLAGQGAEVVGVELVRTAVDELFAEAGLTPEVSVRDGFEVVQAAGVTVWVGDWFAVTRALVGRFDAVWDRAAFVAVGPERFARYVATARHLLTDDGVVLLTTIVRGDGLGPPWSLPEDAVRGWYDGADVALLETAADVDRPGWQELVFRVTGAAR
jgi:thiopurine S-methyltransferase